MPHDDDLPKIGNVTLGDAGVGIVKNWVSTSPEYGGLGFLFRELPTGDVGIDALIEVTQPVEGQARATGRILGAQIKTGPSFFKNDDGDSWSVYIPLSTINYWHAYSVPVVLIIVDPVRKQCYWTRGDASHVRTGATYRIRVPKGNVLNTTSRQALSELAENTTPAGRLLARLEADIPLMRSLADGEKLAVDIQHWWNKSSGRADVYVGYVLENPFKGKPPGLDPISSWITAGEGSVEFVGAMLPWADVEIDEEFYEAREGDLYDVYLAETGTYDNETGEMFDSRGYFDEWKEQRRNYDGAMPYEVLGGEVGCYRFRIAMNELGSSFLRVYEYLHGEDGFAALGG